jgi:hypothetical protein
MPSREDFVEYVYVRNVEPINGDGRDGAGEGR